MELVNSSFDNIQQQLETWLTTEFGKSDESYSVASPYGQLISVLNRIRENVILHVKAAYDNFDLDSSIDSRVISAIARTAGHDPIRAISASGSISLRIRVGADVTEIGNSTVIFKDKSLVRCVANGLQYTLLLNSDVTWNCLVEPTIVLPAIQGTFVKQTNTGNGEITQRVSISATPTQQAEQFNYEVRVNGVLWEKKSDLFSMVKEGLHYYARTGFNGALDIIFGTGDNGKIPEAGAIIEVTWLKSDGADGNLFQDEDDDWIFLDEILDGRGNQVDIQQYFITSMADTFRFGASRENIELTRSIVPLVSTNYVLALPEQFEYYVGRLGIFTHIRAWAETGDGLQSGGTVYLNLVPDLTTIIGSGGKYDYFSLPQEAFLLGDVGKTRILNYLKANAIMHIGTEIKIIDPFIRRYAINVYCRLREGYREQDDANNAKNACMQILADTFTFFTRKDRLPLSDLIAAFEYVPEIDSVRADFISERNEAYHSNYFNNPNYDPNLSFGIDADMGDLIFSSDEIPVLRGGWYDRDGNRYVDGEKSVGELGAFNFYVINPAPVANIAGQV